MAPTSQLIDQYGNPLQSHTTTKEFAAPTMGSVRSVWSETVLSGLDPKSMQEVLKQAGRGFPDKFFILAEEMEERDLHYGAVLGTRKRAITGVAPMVIAASDSAEDEKIAEAVRTDILDQPEFVDDYTTDLSDALGKGYSIVETIWESSERQRKPLKYLWRDPRHFLIDPVDGRTVRMKSETNGLGEDLPPFIFSIHRPKLKSGLPIRGGLARLAAWAFLFKSYTLKDWMAFLEIYGMPLRVGKYGRSASHDDKRILLRAVRDISSDAAAIIPKDMEIEFIEAAGGTGNAVFSSKAEYLDRQISKGVLGQTMTTDDGSSLGQATVHENVRHDIARADARQMAITTNRDLIRPYVDFNFGPQKKYPTYVIPITENEDIKALVDAIDKLVPLGLEVSMPEVRTRIGFEEPDKGVAMMRVTASAAPVDQLPPEPPVEPKAKSKTKLDEKAAATKASLSTCPNCGGNHALAADQTNELDTLVEDALGHWQSDTDPLFAPIQALFARAKNYDDISTGLEDLAAKIDAGPLADRLAKLTMVARGLGDTGQGE